MINKNQNLPPPSSPKNLVFIGFHSMQAEQSRQGIELHEKEKEMDEKDIGKLTRKSPKKKVGY